MTRPPLPLLLAALVCAVPVLAGDAGEGSYSDRLSKIEGTASLAVAHIPLDIGVSNSIPLSARGTLAARTYLSPASPEITSDTAQDISGFADVLARAKTNLCGGAPQTATNGTTVPVAVKGFDGVSLGMMSEIDVAHDDIGTVCTATLVNSATLGLNLTQRLGTYVAFEAERNMDSGSAWGNTVDFGFTYALNEDAQLETGVNVGVTRETEGLGVFMGMSFRW